MKLFKKTGRSKTYNPNISLTDIANIYETDKGNANKQDLSWGSNYPDHYCMNYTASYEKYMSPYREVPVKVFEIGICDKRFPYASVKMWLNYFKDIDLYSVDNFWGSYLDSKIDDIAVLNNMGCNFIYADQGNFCDWNELKNECPNDFDFFIEDGSHWPNHMAVSLWQARDMIKTDGYYFMEDLQNPIKSRGKFKYDNSLLSEDLLNSINNQKFYSHFLNDDQNNDVNNSFKLIDMVLDDQKINYLAIFKKK
jgi:hypothetical protein